MPATGARPSSTLSKLSKTHDNIDPVRSVRAGPVSMCGDIMSASTAKHPIRRILDSLYLVAGYIAAACLAGILVIIVMQMVARWSSLTFPGATQYAGYLMASSTFLAFAYALNNGAHIRMSLLLNVLGKRKYWAELWCLLIGTAASAYVAWYAVKFVYWSHKLHEVSQGQDATQLWHVQLPVAIGAIIFAICFADNLVSFILNGKDNVDDGDEAGFSE